MRHNRHHQNALLRKGSQFLTPSTNKGLNVNTHYPKNQAYTFFGRPNSGRLIDSDSCEFFPITIPCDMGHRLSTGYSVVARLESRKSGWLHIKKLVMRHCEFWKVSYMDTSSCESCVDGWGRWSLWGGDLVLWCWHGNLKILFLRPQIGNSSGRGIRPQGSGSTSMDMCPKFLNWQNHFIL